MCNVQYLLSETNYLFACNKSKLAVIGHHIRSGYKFLLLLFLSLLPLCIFYQRAKKSRAIYSVLRLCISLVVRVTGIFFVGAVSQSVSIDTSPPLSATSTLSSVHGSILFVLFILSDQWLARMWNKTAPGLLCCVSCKAISSTNMITMTVRNKSELSRRGKSTNVVVPFGRLKV